MYIYTVINYNSSYINIRHDYESQYIISFKRILILNIKIINIIIIFVYSFHIYIFHFHLIDLH